jgi:hypothetical protein
MTNKIIGMHRKMDCFVVMGDGNPLMIHYEEEIGSPMAVFAELKDAEKNIEEQKKFLEQYSSLKICPGSLTFEIIGKEELEEMDKETKETND